MDDHAQAASIESVGSAPVFVSYATADRKQALSVCTAMERRGVACWISTRDVAPGENYQEAIVRSLRAARAMVLVFSDAANNSDEIKKELSLASRYHIPVMALRIEDVEPSDAFEYELSTRQWIDAFTGWDKSIDALVGRISARAGATDTTIAPTSLATRHRASRFSRRGLIAAAIALIFAIGTASWFWVRPSPAADHSMMVRLTGFQRLSTDFPSTMPDAVRDEIIAAFGDQGVVGVSTASAPAPGPAPAYALGGTIRRDGDRIRVITRLTNERSGVTLWSESFDYDGALAFRVPRRIAVDSGNILRCGLFGASTYPKPLPDAVMSNYLQFCQRWMEHKEPGKALEAARKVVAAAPDFSWGWSAVTVATVMGVAQGAPSADGEQLRKEGLQAAGKALALDPSNSEAFAQRAFLLDWTDLVAQEKSFKQAIAARPLSCGCEHVAYAFFLENVGRYAAAAVEVGHGVDMLALDDASQFVLGDSLTATGRRYEGKQHLDAFIELSRDPGTAGLVALIEAPETGDYAAGIKALADSRLPMPAQRRAALLEGFRAMASGDSPTKARAVKALLDLPDDQKDDGVMKALSRLGASHEALDLFVKGIGSRYDWPSFLWYRSMRGVLDDPRFPAVAERLGLMRYWKATHTKPDVCSSKDQPAFCRMI